MLLLVLLLLVVMHVLHVVLDLSFHQNEDFPSKTAVFFFLEKTISFHISSFVVTRLRERRSERRGGEVFLASRDKRQIMSGVRTRAQKRRIGERDVWDLIVNDDDICFKHILPRLNSNGCEILVRSESGDEKVD